MKAKLLQDQAGERTFALVFDAGEEAVAGLTEFARNAELTAARLTAIGAFRNLVLGFFDPDVKRYLRIVVDEQVEVLSLVGNVARHQDKPKVHVHAVVGKRDGTAHGGHLIEGHVRPTLEVILVESPAHLRRTMDETAGIARLGTD